MKPRFCVTPTPGTAERLGPASRWFSRSGKFRTVVILDCDWMAPKFERRTRNLHQLRRDVEEAAAYIQRRAGLHGAPQSLSSYLIPAHPA